MSSVVSNVTLYQQQQLEMHQVDALPSTVAMFLTSDEIQSGLYEFHGIVYIVSINLDHGLGAWDTVIEAGNHMT